MQRTDANAIALQAIRSILDAAHDLTFSLDDGTEVVVKAEQLPDTGWPDSSLEGLDPERDGAWPPRIRLHHRWPTGELRLETHCYWWKSQDSYRHMVGITVRLEGRVAEIAWITFGVAVRGTADGERATILATLSFSRHKPHETPAAWAAWRGAVQKQADAAGLVRPTPANTTLCEVDVPTGEVFPSSAEAFARLAKLSLLKATALSRATPQVFSGQPPFGPAPETRAVSEPVPSPRGDKRHGIWPMPGGIRAYRSTVEAMLGAVQEQPGRREGLYDFLEERFGVTGSTSRKNYVDLLLCLELLHEDAAGLSLTDAGEAWLADPDPVRLFEHLSATFSGLVELLALIEYCGPADAQKAGQLKVVLGASWQSDNQVYFRRNWLLSLGLTERDRGADRITKAGLAVLAAHPEVALQVRQALGTHESTGTDHTGGTEGDGSDDPGPEVGDDLLDLRAEQVRPHLGRYQPPDRVLAQCCAALSAGRHLLLVGPPGTGKTELAELLATAAESEGYCLGLRTATASADWTTFDTIGGYALERSGKLAFRPGVFPRALADNCWLLVDELNRADVDKAFGELMTVLSGKGTTTPYEDADGKPIHIGPEEHAAYRVRPAFRVIATMNTWDKTSLFRLSAALQRRFATVHVGVPAPAIYTAILQTEAARPPALPEAVLEPILRMFSPDALLAHRAVGPAVPLDMLRYLRHCPEEDRLRYGLPEATALSLLSQLEGLPLRDEAAVHATLQATIAPLAAPEAWAALDARLRELFTSLPEG